MPIYLLGSALATHPRCIIGISQGIVQW